MQLFMLENYIFMGHNNKFVFFKKKNVKKNRTFTGSSGI